MESCTLKKHNKHDNNLSFISPVNSQSQTSLLYNNFYFLSQAGLLLDYRINLKGILALNCDGMEPGLNGIVTGCMMPSTGVTFVPYWCYGMVHDSLYPGITDTYFGFGLKAQSLIVNYYDKDFMDKADSNAILILTLLAEHMIYTMSLE